MAYIIYSKRHGPIAYVDAPVALAELREGEIAIPCERGADVNDAARWRAEAEYITENGYIAPTLELARKVRLAEIADERYNEETGGIEFQGVTMHTDRESQAKYIGAIVALNALGTYPPNWKGMDGWLAIPDGDTLNALAAAVESHVSACYAREYALQALIEAATTIEEAQAVGWETDIEETPPEEPEEPEESETPAGETDPEGTDPEETGPEEAEPTESTNTE
jgi:hypothetical protein